MGKFILFILLYIQPWCFGNDDKNRPTISYTSDIQSIGGPSQLNNLLNKPFIIFNGRITNLRTIYGDILPTAANFRIGHDIISTHFQNHAHAINMEHEDVNRICAANLCLERRLSSRAPDGQLEEKATPTEITEELLENIRKPVPKITAIVGDSRSGKTVSLRKIEQDIVRSSEFGHWTVLVNVNSIILHFENPPSNDITPEMLLFKIIQHYIPIENRILFANVLEVNPKQVIFLIDGLDQLVGPFASSFVRFIKFLADADTPSVVCASTFTLRLFADHNINYLSWELTEMDFTETKNMLKNIWRHNVRTENIMLVPGANQRLDEYMSSLTALLLRTPIPRQPEMLMLLSSQLNNPYQFDSSHEYVRDPAAPLSVLRSMIYREINIDRLYNEFVIKLLNRRNMVDDLPDTCYGPIALERIFRRLEVPEIASALVLQISEDLEEAKISLATESQSSEFMKYVGNELEFIYPDLEYYFAAIYVTDRVGLDENAEFILRRILSDSRYARIIEFINASPEQQSLNFQTILSPFQLLDRGQYLKMLDNFLSHGFQRLFLLCIDELKKFNQFNEIINYLKNSKLVLSLESTTFGVLNSQSYSRLAINENLPKLLSTRMESLVEIPMTTVYSTIFDDNIPMRLSSMDFQEFIERAVTKPGLYMRFMRNLVEKGPGYEFHLDFDRLLYRAISERGDSGLPMVKFLAKYVTNPRSILINGENLLQAAAKWNDVDILRFVVAKLNIPVVDAFGQVDVRVLAIALDSNPTPLFTPTGWWQKMSYLITEIAEQEISSIQHEKIINDISNTRISLRDLRSKWLEIMLGGTPMQIEDNTDLNTMKIAPLSAADPQFEQNLALIRVTPPSQWGLSPETLALRREFLVQTLKQQNAKVSLAEILINYRGLGFITSNDHLYYRSTVTTVLSWEKDSLTLEDRQRLFNALVDNIASIDDFHDLNYICRNALLERPDADSNANLHLKIIEKLTRASSQISNERMILMSERLLQRSINYRIPGVDIEKTMMTILKASVAARTEYEGVNNADLTICLAPSRLRRQIQTQVQCFISWKDVEVFNDSPVARDLSQIRVNSDKFLRMIADTESSNLKKFQQLISLVRTLDSSVITGRSKMLMRDVLKHGSFSAYRQHQRMIETMYDTSEFSVNSKSLVLPTKNAVVIGATVLPLIRTLFGTINICLEQQNNSECLIASSGLVFATALPAVGYFSSKYLPWMIQGMSNTALHLFPAVTPAFIIKNTKLLSSFGLRFVGKGVSSVLAGIGIGFDVYNIVQVTKMLRACSQQASGCPSKEKIDAILSLAFSSVSIIVTVGLLSLGTSLVTGAVIGLALMALEMLLTGINEVIYHKRRYQTTVNENFRIFFHRIFFMSSPADVQALERRTDWVNALAQHGSNWLRDGSDSIVAYAVGIGTVQAVNDVTPGFSIINMAYADEKNTEDLSRVLPKISNEFLPLCLPKKNTSEAYEVTDSSSVPSATYNCWNSFVIAHEERWLRGFNDESTIIFDLEYVESGSVIGSDLLNNLFLINNGSVDLIVSGGTGNTTDTYVLQSEGFAGTILLNKNARKSIIDVSAVPSSTLLFSWSKKNHTGTIEMGNSSEKLYIKQDLRNLHFIGRSNKPDIISCNWTTDFIDLGDSKTLMSVDSAGGSSLLSMDEIYDCKITAIRPFTHIFGSLSSDATYTPYLWLNQVADDEKSSGNVSYSTINVLQSKFIITFLNRPLLLATNSLKYLPSTKTLVWNVKYTLTSSLELSITPYKSLSIALQSSTLINSSNIHSTSNCMFMDGYLQATIDPVIELGDENQEIVPINTFNILVTVNSSVLVDIKQRYRRFHALQAEGFFSITRMFDPVKNQTFIFGSIAGDRLIFDKTSVFLHGSHGSDIYTLNNDTLSTVWIDNQAKDLVFDTLLLPDGLCDSLHATIGTVDSHLSPGSKVDVVLTCRTNQTRVYTPDKRIILMNFLLDPEFRHLIVCWNDSMYVPLPRSWISRGYGGRTLDMMQFFSFYGQALSLTLTGDEKYIAVNGTGNDNLLVVYRSGLTDAIVTTTYFTAGSSAFILLKDFFADDRATSISKRWHDFKMFILNDVIGEDPVAVVTAEKILLLSIVNNLRPGNLIVSYHVNISEPAIEHIFEHNDNSTGSRENHLGVLIISGAEPSKFDPIQNGNSLELRHQKTRIIVKNWCLSSRHRVYRIEFLRSPIKSPVVVRYIDHLECSQVVAQLTEKLRAAQKHLAIVRRLDDSDKSRLIKCLGSFLADIVTNEYAHFGFVSTVDQAIFIRDNCYELFAQEDILDLRFYEIIDLLRSHQFVGRTLDFSMSTQSELRRKLLFLNPSCWDDLIHNLYNYRKQLTVVNLYMIIQSFKQCI